MNRPISIIYATDIHLSDKGPRSRIDNYFESICSKLEQIDKIAKYRNVHEVILGGDVCHSPYESYRVFNWLNNFLKNTHVKWQTLIGQSHDYVGNWESTKEKTIIHSLSKNGVLELLGPTMRREIDGVKIFASHQAICPNTFFGSYTSYKDLNEDCDIVLLSHLHFPFPTEVVNGKTFLAPGSISRNSSDVFNQNRTPQIVYLEISNGRFSYEFIPLQVSQDIWDKKYLIARDNEKNLGEVQSMEKLERFMDVHEPDMDASHLIMSLGSGYTKEVVETALEYKGKVENE